MTLVRKFDVLTVVIDVTCAISALHALPNVMKTNGKWVLARAAFIRDPKIVALLRIIALKCLSLGQSRPMVADQLAAAWGAAGHVTGVRHELGPLALVF
jgi:hypothetical protein